MEIALVRHTEVNVPKGTLYGFSDVGLSEDAAHHINVTKSLVSEFKPQTVISSPLSRCAILAKSLYHDNGIIYEPNLRELNFGDWEMKSWMDIPQDKYQYWMNDFVNEACPQGESFQQLYARCINMWNKVIRRKDERITVVTHSGVIRSIIAHILNMPLDKAFSFEIDYGSVSMIKVNEGFASVKYLNYTASPHK